ncbi:immunoglobulin domain-containing protein oig-4-like [Tachypleus tridentatus]|uniref:immunoglobulin domain-containing protein oig-4-like n=1 Tax=Tachypleus tridentatus TaxID=6853 RepID=UPI003FD3C0CA
MKYHISLISVSLVLLLFLTGECIRFRDGRRRHDRRRPPIPSTHTFYTHPSRKEYYNNPNGATVVLSSHYEYEFYLGHKIMFICVAKGNPLPRITWYKDSVELGSHPYLQISEWKRGKSMVKSKLEITPARQMDSGVYECQANNKYSVDRKIFKANVSSYS